MAGSEVLLATMKLTRSMPSNGMCCQRKLWWVGGWVGLLLQLPVWNLNFILISLITSNLISIFLHYNFS